MVVVFACCWRRWLLFETKTQLNKRYIKIVLWLMQKLQHIHFCHLWCTCEIRLNHIIWIHHKTFDSNSKYFGKVEKLLIKLYMQPNSELLKFQYVGHSVQVFELNQFHNHKNSLIAGILWDFWCHLNDQHIIVFLSCHQSWNFAQILVD